MKNGRGLERGSLRSRLRACTAHALECGALQPIETEEAIVEEGGIRFAVRVVSSLVRKHESGKTEKAKALTGGGRRNPFLPYDEDLFVGDLSETHVCLLNKFKVIDEHLLLVTRRFEDQETVLSREDFEALRKCLSEYEGLGFYNGGSAAGASQPHKHLQFVPLPLGEGKGGGGLPIDPWLRAGSGQAGLGRLPGLDLVHGWAPGDWSPEKGAEAMHECYWQLLEGVGLGSIQRDGEARQSGAYNLLVTREWMLLVPRSRECFEGVSVNALGFAGSFFVRNAAELGLIRREGPLSVLRAVGR